MRVEPRDVSAKPNWKLVVKRIAEAAVFLFTGAFLIIALLRSHPTPSPIREFLVENAGRETGALNLVTSIYLGYRAYDTLGETIVLLLAVSGVIIFVGRDR